MAAAVDRGDAEGILEAVVESARQTEITWPP
jgi:hypothetical protein